MANPESKKLAVDVIARVDKLEKEMKKASRAANDNFQKIERGGKKMADNLERDIGGATSRIGGLFKSFGGGLAAGLAAGGIVGIVSKLSDVARGIAQIGDRAKQAGLDTRSFQELAFVAEQNRIEVDSLTAGIREMQIRLNEFVTSAGKSGTAAESLGRLGYTVDDISNKLRRPNDLFAELIGKVRGLDRASQIRIFDDIFGGDGEKFVRLIARGEKGIRDQIQAANDLGIVMDEEMIAKADELDRKFQAVTTTVGTGLKQAIVSAASALQDFIDRFREVDARQTETLETQLAEAERNLKAAQGAEGRLGGIFDAAVEKQIATSQAEVDRLQQVLRDRTLNNIRPQLESMRDGGVAPRGDRLGYTPPRPDNGGGRSGSAAAAKAERDAVAELIAELEEELRLVGATDLERETANALRKAGAEATADQQAKIVSLVAALHAEEEATRNASEASQELRDIGRDVLGGIVSDLREGKSAADILANALDRVADRLTNMALDTPFGGGILKFGRVA